jgi:hypothetical protein
MLTRIIRGWPLRLVLLALRLYRRRGQTKEQDTAPGSKPIIVDVSSEVLNHQKQPNYPRTAWSVTNPRRIRTDFDPFTLFSNECQERDSSDE